jgi:hypothetical protein
MRGRGVVTPGLPRERGSAGDVTVDAQALPVGRACWPGANLDGAVSRPHS